LKTLVPRPVMVVFPVPSEQITMFLATADSLCSGRDGTQRGRCLVNVQNRPNEQREAMASAGGAYLGRACSSNAVAT
jgi:hypothetical protein